MTTLTEAPSSKAVKLVRSETSVAVTLDRMGYRLLAVEIDAAVGRARIEVRRHDGYTLTLDIRPNASSITREMLRRETVAVGRRGDRFHADRLSMQFLGRTRVAGIGGARAALRAFADTISANTTSATRLDAHAAIGMLGTSLVNEPG